MSTKNFTLILILFIAVLFLSCKKDIDTDLPVIDNGPSFSIPASSPVTGKITGIVVDENNSPVVAADVVVSGAIYQTDSKGFFQTANIQLDKYVSTVSVTKPGYFKAMRSFSATASVNYVSIKLISKTLSGTVDAAAGGVVNLSSGTVISLPQNGMIIKSSGAAYTGSVNIYAAYIDPTSSDFAAKVPGSMMGKDTGNMYVLQSTGMIAVDLESASGQSLQLATGKTANIQMPIPASLLSKAPASIDTWSLNDQGVWVKEGTATRNGDHYDMQVSHFSFWNCDVPANAIYLTIHVKDQNNNPMPNVWVQLTIPNNNTWWATTNGMTDNSGTVAGLVPANLGLLMNISSNIYTCNTPFYSQNIGPFTADTTIEITVTVNASESVTLNGTANDCNGLPIQSGLASIQFGAYNYYTTAIVNGSYSITVPFCSAASTATIWLVDSVSGNNAGPFTVAVTGSPVVVPPQTICINTQTGHFLLGSCSMHGTYTVGVSVSSSEYISVIVHVTSVGHYDLATYPANGLQFSDTGTFNHTGADTIILRATGTPVNIGYSLASFSTGTQGSDLLLFTGTNAVQADYTFGGPGGCTGVVVSGNYIMNNPLNATNTVSLTAYVTSPGAYFISTTTPLTGPNPITFADTGVFVNTGNVTVVLKGTGTPLAATTYTLPVMGNALPGGCIFNVVSTNNTIAAYTFAGAPGNCAGTVVNGTYQTGAVLTSQNTVSLTVNVTTAGYYSIASTIANGISFSGSGVFTTTGVQVVTMVGTGLPQAAGAHNFTSIGNGSIPGCVFSVTTL